MVAVGVGPFEGLVLEAVPVATTVLVELSGAVATLTLAGG